MAIADVYAHVLSAEDAREIVSFSRRQRECGTFGLVQGFLEDAVCRNPRDYLMRKGRAEGWEGGNLVPKRRAGSTRKAINT
jgi:hypothetical protein